MGSRSVRGGEFFQSRHLAMGHLPRHHHVGQCVRQMPVFECCARCASTVSVEHVLMIACGVHWGWARAVFYQATSFNQALSFDTSAVTRMASSACARCLSSSSARAVPRA